MGDDDRDGFAVTKLCRSIVSSDESETDVFVSSPDSIHWISRKMGCWRHAAD